MVSSTAAEQVQHEIVRLCHAGLDSNTLRFEVLRQIRKVVPTEAWCWPTADPSTLLINGSLGEGLPDEVAPRFFQIEYSEDDYHKFADLACRSWPVGLLAEATEGELERSPRWREIFGPLGFGDDLRAALVVDSACWGYLALHRERSRPDFTADEAAFIARVTSHLAEGLRTALLLESIPTEDVPDGPGLLLLADDLSVVAATPTTQRWLDEVAADEAPRVGELPNAVYAVAARLRSLEQTNGSSDLTPRARLRTRSGRWLVVHASRLSGRSADGQIAVILELAQPWEIAPMIVQAYDLSEREQELTQLVFRGLSTAEIAAELHITANTVQDHLKAIFDKVGVRSRRDLVARVFAEQYWPRMMAGARPGANGWFAS